MASSVGSGAAQKVMSVHFEVYGKVQGVFFRKYTQARAEELNLRGWIRNTSRRTVEGDIEGLSGMLNPGFFYNITWYLRRGKILPDLESFA